MAKVVGVQMVGGAGLVKPFGAVACALAVLALGACSEPQQAPPPAPSPAQTPAAAVETPVPTIDLSGDWTVAQIWGSDPDPGTTVIQVAITADRIRAQSQCKHWWWTYTVAGGTFDATTEPYPDPMCERTTSYWERYFAEAIDRASTLVPYPDGAVLITGPGGQVLLRPKG